MNILIVGCGNSGLIHAAKLIQKKHKVGVLKPLKTFKEPFYDIIEADGQYKVRDETNRNIEFVAKPEFITVDASKAVNFADIIFITTVTSEHENVAKLIFPYVKNNHVIVLIPGYMGSLIFKKYIDKDVIYSECETTAYNGRIVDNEYVKISFFNPRIAFSVLPINKKQEVSGVLSACFDNAKYTRENILESALHNPNMIVHTIGVLFSAARIEMSKGEFYMYKEAFSPSIIKVIQHFDIQKNKVLEKFGCKSLNYFDAAKWRNTEDLNQDSLEVFRQFANKSNKGPGAINSRYLTEDVPMGLCLFSSIARVVGVSPTISDSIIYLSSSLLGVDFWKEGRTIERLLDKRNVEFKDIVKAIS